MGVEIIYNTELAERSAGADPADLIDEIDEREAEEKESRRPRVRLIEFNLRSLYAVAKALEHIRNLEDLDRRVRIDGEDFTLREAADGLRDACCSPRRLVGMMMRAGGDENWTRIAFWSEFCPEMTDKQMASLLKINGSTVKYLKEHKELPPDAYDYVPENR